MYIDLTTLRKDDLLFWAQREKIGRVFLLGSAAQQYKGSYPMTLFSNLFELTRTV